MFGMKETCTFPAQLSRSEQQLGQVCFNGRKCPWRHVVEGLFVLSLHPVCASLHVSKKKSPPCAITKKKPSLCTLMTKIDT